MGKNTKVIHAKLGTMPADYYEVQILGGRDYRFDIGSHITLRPMGAHGCKWEFATIDMIDEIDNRPFYFLSRW